MARSAATHSRAPTYSKARAPAETPAGSETVAALARGLAILHCFSDPPADGLLSHGELAKRTGIPKPTVTRLVGTLVSHGYLKEEPGSERYGLAAGVMGLARAFLSGLDIRAAARPRMQALAEEFDASVYLAICDAAEMVVIEACRSRSSALSSRLDVGSRVPMAPSALGRAYLAAVPEGERDSLLVELRRQANWRKEAAGLERALRAAPASGYCLSLGEWHQEVSSVAVALPTPRGEIMTLNCGGPAFRFGEAHLRRRVAPRLLDVARAIAEEIGAAAPLAASA